MQLACKSFTATGSKSLALACKLNRNAVFTGALVAALRAELIAMMYV